MDVVLVSAGSTGTAPHWSAILAGELAAQLRADGADVRWLCPHAPGFAPPAAPAGVQQFALPRRCPPFRGVVPRTVHTALDVRIAHELRRRHADLVVHLGLGADASANPLWIAARMGSRAVAVVAARELLCHRGTLVDERGQVCTAVDDPERCATCCNAATPSGPGPFAAALARGLRPFGCLSPFPGRHAFRTRFDVLLANVADADQVLVASAAEAELLRGAGVSVHTLVVTDFAAPAVVAAMLAGLPGS